MIINMVGISTIHNNTRKIDTIVVKAIVTTVFKVMLGILIEII